MKIWLALATSAQQQTEAFKKWFGKSKVVDENGKPLRVYHGTTKDFHAFDSIHIPKGNNENGVGFYFTNRSDWTDLYSGGEGGNTVAVYLKIQKPIYYEKQPKMTRAQALKFMFYAGNKHTKQFLLDNYADGPSDLERAKREYVDNHVGLDLVQGSLSLYGDLFVGEQKEHMFAEFFKDVTGYDGIIIDRHNGGAKNYVVFLPTQIKSAVGNKGTFKPRTTSIHE
jgi:hypothetical protein